MKHIPIVVALVCLAPAWAAADTAQCKATRDVWLSAVGQEANYNMGAASTIKLKVWQEFGLVDFDVSALKGKKVSEAWLYVKPAGGGKLNLNRGSDLRWLIVSTVSHDWVEGKSARYGTDDAGHGATFNESSYGKDNWGWEGAKVWDVILGNGNTLRFDGQLLPAGGWLKMKIDPRLVAALVAGASHGLLLMDGSTYVGVNNMIASRESGSGPYLEVTTAGDDKEVASAPTGLKVVPSPNWASEAHGAVELKMTVPTKVFAYRITVNGQPAARWQIPFAVQAGGVQAFPLVDLPADADVKIEVTAVDAAGNESPVVAVTGRTSPKITVPVLPAYPFSPKGGEPKVLGEAKVWAFPEITKVSPTTGEVLSEKLTADIRRKNAVWDGAGGTVRLAAARGEIVSFQLAVEGPAKGCKVEVSSLDGPGQVSSREVRLWRNWYVEGQPEYALPLAGADTFDCPAEDNKIAGQKLQALTVDYHIPKDSKAGEYAGTVKVSSGAGAISLLLKVKVYDVTIPDDIHFNPELNCYGGPGSSGSRQFKDSFKLAHYHRCTINRVPYDQKGRVHEDWAGKVDAAGHVTDWSTFDAGLGPLLDGSLFKDSPRPGVPVPTLYLPLSESYPLDFRKHYHPGEGVPIEGKDDLQRLRHDTLAKPIEESLDPAFQDAWVNCASDYVKHAKDKRWNRTVFECFLNNKPDYGYTLWTLDEPFKYLDWAALNCFARLWKKAVNDPEVYTLTWHEDYFRKGLAEMSRSRPTFLFRCDVSRLMWQGSVSDGLMNIMYLGGGYDILPLAGSAKVRMPSILCYYGSCNDPHRSNWESAAWCLETYAHEGDGVLPWQSLAGAGAMQKLDPCGLIIHGGAYGDAIASLRVHALRRGAQDCELLRLLQLKNGWSRRHIGLLVSQKVPLSASFSQRFPDEAAAVTFGSLTSQGFCEMKAGVLMLLTGE